MIDLKMKRYGLTVAVKCTSTDDAFMVNMGGFLPVLEDFLEKLENFDNVHVEITTPKEDDYISTFLDELEGDGIDITLPDLDVSFGNQE